MNDTIKVDGTRTNKPWDTQGERINQALNVAEQQVKANEAAIAESANNQAKATETDTATVQNEQVDFQSFAETQTDDAILNSSHKGVDFNKVLSELPDDAKKLLGNLRADYTRKTQELSNLRKALEAERQALVNSDFVKNINEQAQQEVKLDIYDDASVEARIQNEVAKRLQEMVQPLQNQYELNQRQAKLDQFKADHPDMMDYKTDIAKLLMTDESLSLERAYYIVKGQKATSTAQELEKELKTYKAAAKEYGLKVGGTQRANPNKVPETVRKQGGYAVYKWLQSRKAS